MNTTQNEPTSGNTTSPCNLPAVREPDPVGTGEVSTVSHAERAHSRISHAGAERTLRRMLQKRWREMRRRCNDPKNQAFKNYGGRGIKVCIEWDNFYSFYAWCMGHGFREWLTLDRENNDGGYSPDNCRWTDWSTQQSNRRMTPAAAQHLVNIRAKVDYAAMVRASVRKTSKPIICVETGRRFKSGSSAARFHKITPQSIWAAASDASKTCCGYHWTYANN